MNSPKLLQDISALMVAHLITNDKIQNSVNTSNAAALFPKNLVERILPCVLYLQHLHDRHVHFNHLDVLLSGHLLTDIRICYTKMYQSDFDRFMELLSKQAQVITCFVLKENRIVPDNPVVRISKRLADVEQVVQPISSLERFLPLSKNLRQLDTDVPLNPTCLENAVHLEDLCFCPSEAAAFYGDKILAILKTCQNLTNLSVDIAMAMELLIQEGSMELPKFRLQKTVLECLDMGGFTCVLYGERGMCIMKMAAITCPDLKELHIRTNDQYIFDAISYFPSLEHLHILQHGGPSNMYFSDAMPEVLTNIGQNMKCLRLENIHEMDFGLLAEHFPLLNELKVEFWHEVSSPDLFPKEPLKNLEILHLNGQECTRQTLLLLLSSCRMLQELVLYNVRNLDDDVLMAIHKMNPLERLRWCHIADCSLSKKGLLMLLETCKDLRTLIFSSSIMSDDVCEYTVNVMRPDIFNPPDTFKYWKDVQCFNLKVPFSMFFPSVQFSLSSLEE